MAGGTWETQNKVRPGVYINFASGDDLTLNVGDRGVVAICEPMSWGPVGQVMTVEAGMDTTSVCGYAITAPEARFLREIFRGSNRTAGPQKVLLYRPAAASSAKATATTGQLTATARYPGARGNDIAIAIQAQVDEEDLFLVQTLVDGTIVDSQAAATIADLTANAWVEWSGSGALAATAGVPLANGADGEVQTAAYASFLTAIEPYAFDILIYDGTDETTQTAYCHFVQRLAEENGQYCQLVAAGLSNPDSRFVINVQSGVTLANGETLSANQVCWWVGGAQAGARYNESLTYAVYPQAVAVSPVLTNDQMVAALKAGNFVLFADQDAVKVEWDINSLTSYTTDIGEIYHKNRVIRLCNTIANDLYRQFADGYIGVVNNDETGRGLFKGAIVGYLLEIQTGGGIQNFAADDVEVLAGDSIESIVVKLAIQPVDAVEKIYLTITVG